MNKRNNIKQITEKQMRRAVLSSQEKKDRRIILRKNTGLQANERQQVTESKFPNPLSVLDNPIRYDSI